MACEGFPASAQDKISFSVKVVSLGNKFLWVPWLLSLDVNDKAAIIWPAAPCSNHQTRAGF